MSNTQTTIPPGYLQRADGALVPESMVKPIDLARDQLVRELVAKAQAANQVVSSFKAEAFREIEAFVDLSAEQYGVKIGGAKGNVTLTTFDGRYKLIRQVQETLTFDERLQAAKQLIDQCIRRWTEGGRDEIRVLVNDAFKVDKEGLINTGRVLGLKRLNITDPEWQQAMQAIGDSVQVASSKAYVRVYERIGSTDRYQLVSLDVAGA